MSVFEVLIATLFGINLPSADVGSDLWLAIRILTQRDWQCGLANTKITSQDSAMDTNDKIFYENQHIYGVVTLTFPTLSFMFVSFHWWRLENISNGGSGRLKTLPILLLQIWPQYRMAKLIYHGFWLRNPEWRKDQKILQQSVTSIEPFIESVPQWFWMTYLWRSTWCFGPIGYVGVFSYTTSILSASFGMTNFLRVGPLKVIPCQPASGFGHPSFYLIFSSCTCSLIALGLIAFPNFHIGPTNTFSNPEIARIACYIFLLFIKMSIGIVSLMASVGFTNTFKLALWHPGLILLPIFTPYTMGPSYVKCECKLSNKLRLSFSLTFLNLLVNSAAMLISVSNQSSDESPTEWSESKRIELEILNPLGLNSSTVSSLGFGVYFTAGICTTALIFTDMCCPSICSKPQRAAKSIEELLSYQDQIEDRVDQNPRSLFVNGRNGSIEAIHRLP